MNPDSARELLVAELAELDERARFAADSLETDPEEEAAVGTHPGDYGTDVANRMDGELLSVTLREQRRRVIDALARLDEGSYGRCAVCGREIDDERLEARLETTTCREHADSHPVTE